MLNSLQLKVGRGPGLPSQKLVLTPITVFVGPNNSGKSLILKEISRKCTETDIFIPSLIADVEFQSSDHIEAERKANKIIQIEASPATDNPDEVKVGKFGSHTFVLYESLLNSIRDPNSNRGTFINCYQCFRTQKFDGQTRISLVNDQGAGDLLSHPITSLQTLFRDDEKRQEVRRIVFDAFGKYFVIDPRNLGMLRIRLADAPPASSAAELSLDTSAREYYSKAEHINTASDGVKAFTGMIAEIVAGDPEVLLIDEPEAFLHPALSFKLGKEIATTGQQSRKRILISTHSPNFLMGCIHAGTPVNVVRLTYRNGISTARILHNQEILRLMRNPLLRSTNVLGGLFYEAVVVTEGDADRAFYQEINERLLREKPGWGIPNCLFLNAQNKQTVRTIIRPLREMGIPAAAIVDIDVLKEGGTVWTDLLKAAFLPEMEHQPQGTVRSRVKDALVQSRKDMKRDGGIALLTGPELEAANNLFDKLAQYGIFVVRGGEVEFWLKRLGCGGHGPDWLISIFEKMGEDPSAATYVHPDEDDVWQFIANIRMWLLDPRRRGIPD